MVHIIAFLIIATVKIIKWVLIKSRFFIAAIPIAIVHIYCNDWYEANTFLADCIGIALIAGVAASWIITLVRYIKGRNHNKELILNWAYKRYGEPNVLTQKP